MRLDHLKYIITIVDLGSINKASKALFINQQQLSKIVQDLEKEFGCKIFNRYSNGVELTSEGKEIHDAAKKVLQIMDECYAKLNKTNEIMGTLTIYSTISYWENNRLYQAYEAFSHTYPNVQVMINEMNTDRVMEICKNEKGIIGYVSIEKTGLLSRELLTEDLLAKKTFIPIYTLPLGILVSKENPYAKLQVISLDEIKNENYAVYTMNEASSFDKYFEEYGSKKYSVSKLNIFFDIIKKNKAIAFSTKKDEKLFEEKEIVFVPLKEKLQIDVGLLVDKDYKNDILVKAFVEQSKS